MEVLKVNDRKTIEWNEYWTEFNIDLMFVSNNKKMDLVINGKSRCQFIISPETEYTPEMAEMKNQQLMYDFTIYQYGDEIYFEIENSVIEGLVYQYLT